MGSVGRLSEVVIHHRAVLLAIICRMFGAGPVLVNMGVNGLLGMLYIFLNCGDLNGPTLGGIFTIIGFSAMGKHAFNIVPVMIGVALGAYGIHQTLDYPSLQLAGLLEQH